MYYDYDYDMYNRFYHMSAGSSFFSLLIGALTIVALWFLFLKAGEEGWAAVVPFYNLYVLFKITWGNGWLFLLMLIPIANIVIGIITMVKLARVFGKGGGWACGLIFLYPIFICITAFSKDIDYVGIPGQTSAYGSGYGEQTYQQPNYQQPYSQDYYENQPNPYKRQSEQNSNYYYQKPPEQSSAKYCPNCGEPLERDEKFCPKCGKQQ